MEKYNLQPWDRFNHLVITWEREYRGKTIYEKCICDCWKEKWIIRWNIMNWIAKSCWCLRVRTVKDTQAKYITKHWMAYTRIYRIFKSLKRRIISPNHVSYKYYWWRWIKCLWQSFEDFYKDMWESYMKHVNKFWERDTTLDRIDRDWDYCKENCRWATWKEQMHNRDIVKLYWFNYVKLKDAKNTD